MKSFPNVSLNFKEAYELGDQLFAFGKFLHDDPNYAKCPNWILTYRYAIRAMLARILSVDRDYLNLNTLGYGLAPFEEQTLNASNWYNVIWESYAGVLFFAMDSSLECFTHALNALGILLSPREFFDITNENQLRWITPYNLLLPPKNDANRSKNSACQRTFPKICAHWSANRDLIDQIIEYHDATKHRHSAVVGQGPDYHLLKPEPKQPMSAIVFNESLTTVPFDVENTMQSITTCFRMFMVELLRITLQEIEAVFRQSLSAPTHQSQK